MAAAVLASTIRFLSLPSCLHKYERFPPRMLERTHACSVRPIWNLDDLIVPGVQLGCLHAVWKRARNAPVARPLGGWMLRVPVAQLAIYNMDEKHRSGSHDKLSRTRAFESADPQGSPHP